MPVKLSDLYERQRSVTLDTPDGSLCLGYKPMAYTGKLETEARDIQKEDGVAAAVVHCLTKCLISWDMEDAKGKPLPINQETLNDLPTPLLGEMWEVVMTDIQSSWSKKTSPKVSLEAKGE